MFARAGQAAHTISWEELTFLFLSSLQMAGGGVVEGLEFLLEPRQPASRFLYNVLDTYHKVSGKRGDIGDHPFI